MLSEIQEIKADLKEVKVDVKELVKVMATNTASLIVHEARTTASEKRIATMEYLLVGTAIATLIGAGIHAILR